MADAQKNYDPRSQIRNARIRYEDAIERKTLQKQLQIRGESYLRTQAGAGAVEAATEAEYASYVDAVNEDVYDAAYREQESIQEEVLLEQIEMAQKKQLALRKAALSKNKIGAVGKMGLRTLIYVVGVLSLFQFFFALFSAITLGALTGKAGWIQKLVEFLGIADVGMMLWGLSSILVLMMLIGTGLYFVLISFNPFPTVVAQFMAIVCWSLALLPFTNIIPWILVWILYLFITSLSRST